MSDRVSVSAGLQNFDECLALAAQYPIGIELMAFAFPHILDSDWRELVARYKPALKDVHGTITLHGPFMDLVSGSPDERINTLTYGRYEHLIRIAANLDVRQVVFHANYIGLLHNEYYRHGWHRRNVDFWGPLGDYAKAYDVVVAIENMWEYDPSIIGNLLEELQHPHLKACLDVGHAHVFSDADVRLTDWLETLDKWIVQLHLNNNNGVVDEHHSFDWVDGVLNYHQILPQLRQLPNKPLMVLEMDSAADMRRSLPYFELAGMP